MHMYIPTHLLQTHSLTHSHTHSLAYLFTHVCIDGCMQTCVCVFGDVVALAIPVISATAGARGPCHETTLSSPDPFIWILTDASAP